MKLFEKKQENKIYTGREIAILTDSHSLLEPTQAVLEDISRRGITEIYSLGDNIGVGPNPNETINLLLEYGVNCIAGNSEDYCTLGIEPFASYFNTLKRKSQLWTLSKLDEKQLGEIKLFPHSIELILGGKRLGLCHFANDVRFDYGINSTWSYQSNIRNNGSGYKQFFHTNSERQKREIIQAINTNGREVPWMRGYVSANEEPLFGGKMIDRFDAIIQGHVHFKIYEEGNSMQFYSLRAVGMAYGEDPVDTASYVILKEKANNMGFDLEELLIRYDREKMIYSVLNCDNPDETIRKFINLR